MLSKVFKFFRYPMREKIRVIFDRTKYIFYFSAIYFRRYSLSYLPDSFIAGKYPYFRKLYERFRKHNKLNNGGDIHRLNSFILNIEYLMSEKNIAGDYAELGVWRGNTAQILAYFAKKYKKQCYFFDTYEGFDERDIKDVDSKFNPNHFSDTSLDMVKDVVGDEFLSCCNFIVGYFPNSVPKDFYNKKFSIVSLDADLYEPMKTGLEHFYPLMSDGGLFLLHDYSSGYWEGCKKAIDELSDKENQQIILMPDKSGSAFIRIRK